MRLHSKIANQGCDFTLRDNRPSRRKYSHLPELIGMQERGAKGAGGGGGWSRHTTPLAAGPTFNSQEGKNANQATIHPSKWLSTTPCLQESNQLLPQHCRARIHCPTQVLALLFNFSGFPGWKHQTGFGWNSALTFLFPNASFWHFTCYKIIPNNFSKSVLFIYLFIKQTLSSEQRWKTQLGAPLIAMNTTLISPQ